MEDGNGTLGFLARSETRPAVLGRLASDGPSRRSGLADALDVSERTVARTVEAIEDREWATATESGYVLTALGEHVLETYESATESLSVGETLEPALARLRADVCDVPVHALADAEVVEATEGAPNAPLEGALSFRQSADSLRELSSIVTKESAAQVGRRLREGDIDELELVVERGVVEAVEETPEFEDSFRELVDADAAAVFVHEGPFPFLLALSPDAAAIGVTNDDGFPSVLVVADSPAAHDWAESVYEQFREEATPFPG